MTIKQWRYDDDDGGSDGGTPAGYLLNTILGKVSIILATRVLYCLMSLFSNRMNAQCNLFVVMHYTEHFHQFHACAQILDISVDNAIQIQYNKINTIQYSKIIYNAHKVEKSNLRRGQSIDGLRCGRWLARKRY